MHDQIFPLNYILRDFNDTLEESFPKKDWIHISLETLGRWRSNSVHCGQCLNEVTSDFLLNLLQNSSNPYFAVVGIQDDSFKRSKSAWHSSLRETFCCQSTSLAMWRCLRTFGPSMKDTKAKGSEFLHNDMGYFEMSQISADQPLFRYRIWRDLHI